MLFEISAGNRHDFDSFVTGSRQIEVCAAMEKIATGKDSAYLWGNAGTGKTHLLNATKILLRATDYK